MFSSPAVAGPHVFVASCAGTVSSLDLASGEVQWRYDTAVDGAAAQFHGDTVVTEGLVVAGSDGTPTARLYALSRSDGSVRWSWPSPGGVASDVLLHGNVVLAVAVAGSVAAFDSQTGEPLWQADDPPPASVGTRPLDPVLEGARLVVPWRSGVVDAYDVATGARLWRRELRIGLATSVAVLGSDVVVGATDGRLIRLRAVDGELAGDLDLGDASPYGELVVTDRCLLALSALGGSDGRGGFAGPHAVTCFDPRTGEARWRRESDAAWSAFRPLARGETVVVGFEGGLLALSQTDGAELWTRPVEEVPRGLAATDSVLLIGTLQGEVLALPWPENGSSGGDVPRCDS